jgi:hypothetical protein
MSLDLDGINISKRTESTELIPTDFIANLPDAYEECYEDPTALADTVTRLCDMISREINPFRRQLLIDALADTFKRKKVDIKKHVDALIRVREKEAKQVSKKEEDSNTDLGTVWYKGDNSIWIRTKTGWDIVASNFHIYIMYVAEDENENLTWVLRLEHESGENIYLEVLHDDFNSPSRLAKIVATKQLALKIGNAHLQELHEYLFNETTFMKAIKITRYGYHEASGAFIFSNGAVVPCEPGEDGKAYKILRPDEFGMIKTDTHSLSMPKLKKNSRESFTITDFDISFDDWYLIFCRTHLVQHAFITVCWKIMSLFRDIALKHQSISPILFLKGGAGSGKSSIVRSMTCLNGYAPKEINLKGKNSEPGMIRTMSATSNGVIWGDEFVNQHPFEGIMQAAYDNAGQVKASGSSGLELDNVELKSALALTSNFQPENPIFFSRCIYNTVLDQTKTADQKLNFDKLKDLEDKGLAQVTIEIIQHRPLIDKHYGEYFGTLYKALKSDPTFRGESVPERLFSNMAQTMTAAFILARAGKIHITEAADAKGILAEFVERGVGYIQKQFRIQTEKTSLHEFFEIIQMCYEKSEIFELVHFKLEENDSIAFKFGSLYAIFKLRYRNMYFRDAPDKESLKDEICKLIGQDESIVFSAQIRFMSDFDTNTNSKTVPTKGCFRCSYTLLEEKFGIDFKSRKIDTGINAWKSKEASKN